MLIGDSKDRKILRIFIILIPLVFVYNFLDNLFQFPITNLSSVFYAGIIIAWGVTISRRIIHKKIRRHLMGVSALLAMLFVIRTAKYLIFNESFAFMRLCNYVYYIPFCMVPFLCFLVACFCDRPADGKYTKVELAIGIITLVMVAMIASNDAHGLAFTFEGYELQKYGPFYYVVVGWAFLTSFTTFGILIKKCMVSQAKTHWYITLIIILFFLIPWTVFYIHAGSPMVMGAKLYSIQEVYSFMFICTMESLIQMGFITSNVGYEEFFKSSRINATITDKEGNVVAATKKSDKHSDHIKTRSQEINGGTITWEEDLTSVENLKSELREVAANIESENELMLRESEIMKERISFETQNRLYDNIAKQVRSQAREVYSILKHSDEPYEEFRGKCLYAMVLGAYIKRMGNLMLISDENGKVPAEELALSIKESMEYLKLSSKNCDIVFNGECNISSADAIKVYSVFEDLIEKNYDKFSTLLVVMKCEGGLKVRIAMDTEDVVYEGETEYEDDTAYINLSYPEVSV